MGEIIDFLTSSGRRNLADVFGKVKPDNLIGRACTLADCLEFGWLRTVGKSSIERTSEGWALNENQVEPTLRNAGAPSEPIEAAWVARYRPEGIVDPISLTDRHAAMLGIHSSNIRILNVAAPAGWQQATQLRSDQVAGTILRRIYQDHDEAVLEVSIADVSLTAGIEPLLGEYFSLAAILVDVDKARIIRRLLFVAEDQRASVSVRIIGDAAIAASLRNRIEAASDPEPRPRP